VWKADHVWSSVVARSFSYPSLHPNVLAKTVTAQAIRLSAADSIRRRTSWTRPFFSFDYLMIITTLLLGAAESITETLTTRRRLMIVASVLCTYIRVQED
jgi:hypothetical protein